MLCEPFNPQTDDQACHEHASALQQRRELAMTQPMYRLSEQSEM